MRHFKAIAAMSLNRVIGDDGRIPWHLPEDFKWFKKMTMGNVVVMGRKTFESLGKPLPNRANLVLSRHPRRLLRNHPEIFNRFREWRGGKCLKAQYQFNFAFSRTMTGKPVDLRIIKSLEMLAPDEFNADVFICGGAQIYEQALPRCSDVYLTLVKRHVEGDAFFPPFEERFQLVAEILDRPEFSILHYRRRGLVEA